MTDDVITNEMDRDVYCYVLYLLSRREALRPGNQRIAESMKGMLRSTCCRVGPAVTI